jgi:hypothetical protein
MSGLLAFLFKGEVPSTMVVVRGAAPGPQPKKSKDLEASRFKLVYFFSRVLSIVLILCLVGAIALKLMGKDDTFLHPIITGIIGYFGGAIAAYFGIRTG